MLSLLALLTACTPTPKTDDTSAPDSDPPSAGPSWEVPTFAPIAGVVAAGLGRGATVADLDGDGALDLVLTASEPAGDAASTINAWRGLGDGLFEPATASWGLVREDPAWGAIPLDADGDGDLDLFTPRDGWYGPATATLEIRGTSTFSTTAINAPPCGEGASMGASAADLDLDGDLDLLVGSGSPAVAGGCVGVYFQDAGALVPAEDVGDGQDDSFGAVAADLNDDQYPELIVSGERGATIYENLGAPPWFDLDSGARTTSLAVSGARFALTQALLDYDQDGDLDVFVCAWGNPSEAEATSYQTLWRNDGGLAFVDVAGELGVEGTKGCMGVGVGDLDSNGFPDLLVGTGGPEEGMTTPDALWMNDGGTFSDAAAEAGLDRPTRTQGVAMADLNADGRLDLVRSRGGFEAGQEEDPDVVRGIAGSFPSLAVTHRGPAGNLLASGARVAVETDAGTRYAWQLTGDGFSSAVLGPVFVGLGAATEIRDVSVRFPDGEVVSTGPLALDAGTVTVSR